MKNKAMGKWSLFWFVLIVGLLLTLFRVDIGLGATFRIPFTKANLSFGGSIGKKEFATNTIPKYLTKRIGSSYDFFNHSTTMTVWLAEGIGVIVLGEQPDAPTVDLRLNLSK